MTVYVDQVLVLGLLIDWREMVPAGSKGEVRRSQKRHGTIGNLLVSKIPTNNGSIQVRFVATLYRIVFPVVTECRNFEALIVLGSCSATSRRPPKEGCRNTV